MAFAYASLTTWSVAVPELSKTFSLTSASAQLGSSLLMARYAIGSFVESLSASRIGLKKTGLLAAVLLLTPQFVIPFLGHYRLILLLRFLQGWGIVWFVTTSMTTAWFPLEQRGMASGIVNAAIPFGIGCGGLLTGRLLEVAGTSRNRCKRWIARRFLHGTAAISNKPSIRESWDLASRHLID